MFTVCSVALASRQVTVDDGAAAEEVEVALVVADEEGLTVVVLELAEDEAKVELETAAEDEEAAAQLPRPKRPH